MNIACAIGACELAVGGEFGARGSSRVTRRGRLNALTLGLDRFGTAVRAVEWRARGLARDCGGARSVGAGGEARGPAIDALASFLHGLAAPGQAKPAWSELERQALALSRTQHAGRPATLRFCEPELKVCNSGIVWTAGDGTKMFLREAEDMRGQRLEREICEINAHGDVRVCIDWDTDARSRDMKDGKGHWYKVADQ